MVREKKKRVSFWATERVPQKVKVSLTTKAGRRVSFTATKRVPRKVKVTFYTRKKKNSR
jgi:hypothetical protein